MIIAMSLVLLYSVCHDDGGVGESEQNVRTRKFNAAYACIMPACWHAEKPGIVWREKVQCSGMLNKQ